MHVTASHELEPLVIASRQGDYPVDFRSSIAEVVRDLLQVAEPLLVLDANIAELFAEELAPVTAGIPTYIVEPSEDVKSFTGVGNLVDWLLAQRAVRTSTLIAIGGGCIQDLVSFTAHIYYRGIDWVFVPTTVLSQADSCIGAKSGINVLPYKNQLGALHSPRQIWITDAFLRTLPDQEVASGYGEIVKLSVISSRSFLTELEQALRNGGIRNPELLTLTRASLAAKQEIIEEDEVESDLRRILNYGHSFGHALEAIANHQVPHGLGVLWGIDVINWLGVQWGITDANTATRMTDIIRSTFDYTLPIEPRTDDLLEMLRRDKKVRSGNISFAILRDEGSFEILPKAIDAELATLVQTYLESDYVFRRT